MMISKQISSTPGDRVSIMCGVGTSSDRPFWLVRCNVNFNGFPSLFFGNDLKKFFISTNL